MLRHLIIICFAFALFACSHVPDESMILDGYTDKTSYFIGEDCKLYLNAEEEAKIDISIYTVDGTKVSELSAKVSPQEIAQSEPWENGFGYQETTTFTIPELASGIYLVGNKIPIIVKSKEQLPITIVYPSNTINAYCNAGGKSLYGFNSSDGEKADILSFQRPQPFGDRYADSLFYKWFSTSFKANYIADIDLDDPTTYEHSEVLVIVGHNEYWTNKARKNFDQFITEGGNAVILSGNSVYWQMRYSDDLNQLICYKDFDTDPIQDTLLKTVKWTDSILEYQTVESIGSDFNRGGYGKKKDDGWDGFRIVSSSSPLLANTGLEKGDVLPMSTTEYDGTLTLFEDVEAIPEIDTFNLGFYRIELVGYDLGYTSHTTVGTFIVFQKAPYSGKIINVGSTEWCSRQTFNDPETLPMVKTITQNMINLLVNGQEVFSTP